MFNNIKEKIFKNIVLITCLIGLDQITKHLIMLLSNIISSPAFIIFKISANTKLSRISLTTLLVITVLSLIFWIYFLKNKKLYLPIILIISGELSNILEYMLKGFIIDFINLRFLIINFADIFIVYGFYKVIVEVLIKKQI